MAVFRGPVFVVGLPRSGTKLLRDLLNRNPRVSIPEAETHFIPYFLKKYGVPPSFEQKEVFDKFCGEIMKSTFFRYMLERGYAFSSADLSQAADLRDWSSIFEHLLRLFGPRARSQDAIFGDKTPGYLRAMLPLKRIFPTARFLHMIRDPRDCCLSTARAWGLHPYSAAQRWQETLEVHRKVGSALGDYIEIRYEDLIANAKDTLQKACAFVDVEFVPEMLSLRHSNENTGAGKGATEILSNNMNKFWTGLSYREIRRIEEITFDQMCDLGYEIYMAEQFRPLSDAVSLMLRTRDALAFLRWKAESRGLMETTGYLLTRSMRRI